MEDIISECIEKYEVVNLCAILKLNDNCKKEEVYKDLGLFFHDIEVEFNKNIIRVREPVGRLCAITGYSNNDCVEMIIAELKKYNKKSKKIMILEQRLPIESVIYKLVD